MEVWLIGWRLQSTGYILADQRHPLERNGQEGGCAGAYTWGPFHVMPPNQSIHILRQPQSRFSAIHIPVAYHLTLNYSTDAE